MRISYRHLLHSFHNKTKWPEDLAQNILSSSYVKRDFINQEEERCLLKEIEPHMKRLRYEKLHWDDAIHYYREREQRRWSPDNEAVIQRMREDSFPPEALHLTYVHILDLHKDGVIKPHIDSIRYCGEVITGISLLSDAVMRLRHKDDEDLIIDLLLPRRSLYRLGGVGRYDFKHEVLSQTESVFEDLPKVADQSPENVIQLKPVPES